jgi:hypothetical protein
MYALVSWMIRVSEGGLFVEPTFICPEAEEAKSTYISEGQITAKSCHKFCSHA